MLIHGGDFPRQTVYVPVFGKTLKLRDHGRMWPNSLSMEDILEVELITSGAAGGKGQDVGFTISFRDGRKALASASQQAFLKLRASAMENERARDAGPAAEGPVGSASPGSEAQTRAVVAKPKRSRQPVWIAVGVIAVLWVLIFNAVNDTLEEPTTTVAQTAPIAPPEQPTTANTRFVSVEATEERTTPGGSVVNRLYRGQRVEITAREGEWVRVTPLNLEARWVRAADLSTSRPEASAQPVLPVALADPRIQGIPAVGEDGAKERDVIAMRTAAAALIQQRRCSGVEIAGMSTRVDGVYYLACTGERQNRFFVFEGDRVRFCSGRAESC